MAKKKAVKATGVNATKDHRPRSQRPIRNQKVHIREKADKASDTLCGGSHSEIWGRRAGFELQSVGPQQAAKATCGRCMRVARSPRRNLL